MATGQGMRSVDLVAVTAELQQMLPLWVHKVYQREDRLCAIRFNNIDRVKKTIIIEPGKRFHLVNEVPDMPQIPPAFAMFLRKYINGGRVDKIYQVGLTRTIIIDILKSEQVFHLIIEVFDEGNVILCSEDFKIIQPLIRQKFKDRTVLPGAEYILPPPDVSVITQEEFSKLLSEDDRDIVRSLAVGSFLSGMYAEYICEVTKTNKDTPAKEADAVLIYNAIKTLISDVQTKTQPIIADNGCHPLTLNIPESRILGHYPSMNEAMASFLPTTPKEQKKNKRPSLSREERIRLQQTEAVKKFERNIEKNEKIAETIYEHYTEVTEIITVLSNASNNHSWQEIEEILKKDTSGKSKTIKKIYPEDAAVDLDIGQIIKIYIHSTIDQNAGVYYDLVKKFKKKLAGAKVAMSKTVTAPPKHKPGYTRPKKRWFDRFRWFYTTDGTLVLGGRDAGQNEDLVKKYLEGKDTFLHADIHGASVIVVKGETTCWDEISKFAAVFSGAWRSGHASADVFAARPDQVSKTAESGEYLSRGSFVVRGERRWFKDITLETAIGLTIKPVTQIIGGPIEAIQPKSEIMVILKPGSFEPNDIAKKVVREIREKLSPADQSALKFALNTEAIAAFVPPGGSDITEIIALKTEKNEG